MTNTIKVYRDGQEIELPLHRTLTPSPLANKPSDLKSRAASILAAYPCQYRGERIRIEKKSGNCSCSSSPVHQCSQVGEASLWKFSQTQEMACCQRCEVRSVNQ
jgi:hypothetical protein